VLNACPTALAFCAHRNTTISPAPTTFTFRRRKSGDSICGLAIPYRAKCGLQDGGATLLDQIEAVNFEDPEVGAKPKSSLDNLKPLYPAGRPEDGNDARKSHGRVLDLLCPVGKGQRGLIVARRALEKP